MANKLKELIYGKALYNLEIKVKYTPSLINDHIKNYFDNKVIPAGKKRGYIGQFILTDKKFLLKGKDPSLEDFTADINLDEIDNSSGIMELPIVDLPPVTDEHGYLMHDRLPKPKVVGKSAPPHIHFNNQVYRINKNFLGKYLA